MSGDILYLKALSSELKSRRRTVLDPRWTLCPSGGIDRIMPFISLFAGKKLHIAALSDMAQGTKGKTRKIRESEILQAGHFFTVADFIDQDEADIEDIIDEELYLEIVNRVFALKDAYRITAEGLSQDASTPRTVKKVGAAFRVMPNSIPIFDHYTPADWLIRNPDVLSANTDALERTLANAERIFKTCNGLLE